MKRFLLSTVALFTLMAPLPVSDREVCAAADNECQRAFGFNVASCAQWVDLQLLPPKERAEAIKACIESARAAKESCLSGVSQCLNVCQATYNTSEVSCLQTYNPADCEANEVCEECIAATHCVSFQRAQHTQYLRGELPVIAFTDEFPAELVVAQMI